MAIPARELILIKKFLSLLDKGHPVMKAKKILNIYNLGYKKLISEEAIQAIYEICEDRRIRKHSELTEIT